MSKTEKDNKKFLWTGELDNSKTSKDNDDPKYLISELSRKALALFKKIDELWFQKPRPVDYPQQKARLDAALNNAYVTILNIAQCEKSKIPLSLLEGICQDFESKGNKSKGMIQLEKHVAHLQQEECNQNERPRL